MFTRLIVRRPVSLPQQAVAFALMALLLFAGLWALEPLTADGPAGEDLFRGANFGAVVLIGYAVALGEALVFTVVPAEITRRFLRKAWIGLLVGAILYSPVMHWTNGLGGVAVSAWIAAVVGGAWLWLRGTSFRSALAQAIGLKWLFWTYAAASLSSDFG